MKLTTEMTRLIHLASRGSATVLITGPTGAGKTYLARKIHEASPRKLRPFVSVNLATLHEGTFESELFGHERGAFTGADSRRVGKLELAQGGTVFLDEVGELSSRLQARLLEFLQSRIISPVGSNREIKLDVRVITATNRNLRASVARGDFREDLFHRLRVLPIDLKPLNERWNEFDALVHATLSEICTANGRSVLRISEDLARRLETHDWPGNLRELRNVLEFAVISSEGEEIQASDLPPWFGEDSARIADFESVDFPGTEFAQFFAGLDYSSAIARFEKEYLERALQRFRGRINHTARQIGMNKATLIRRMRMYGLNPNECAASLLK